MGDFYSPGGGISPLLGIPPIPKMGVITLEFYFRFRGSQGIKALVFSMYSL